MLLWTSSSETLRIALAIFSVQPRYFILLSDSLITHLSHHSALVSTFAQGIKGRLHDNLCTSLSAFWFRACPFLLGVFEYIDPEQQIWVEFAGERS